MKMNRIVIPLLLGLLFLQITAQAAWLRNVPQTIYQPDGTKIECFATGDEFYNWLHDQNGYTIILDQKTGYYVYAQRTNDQLTASRYVVGQTDPSKTGLEPGINISAENYKEIRDAFFEKHMPKKEAIKGFNAPNTGKNIGRLNNIIVYIRFSDQTEYTKDTSFLYNMFNKQGSDDNSVYNYFQNVSYQQLELISSFYPITSGNTVISYQDIYPRSHYMPYDQNTNPDGYLPDQKVEREQSMLKRAVNYINDQIPENLDIDYNNDGYVDNVAFVVRGEATAWSTLLWPHRWVLYSEYAYIHGKRVYDYNLLIEGRLNLNGAGLICHEMFHTLGAHDLYHWDSHPVKPVDEWDIMAQLTNPPQSMGAYMKYRYGTWIDEIPEITECGTYSLNPLTSPTNNCFKIASPNSETDYFVLEYRKQEGIFEAQIPSSGLLIYKINANEDGNGNSHGPPDEIYIYRPNGTLEVNGQINDAAFSLDHNLTEFNNSSNPACFLSNGQPGGINIFNVGSCGETITFDVNLQKAPVANFSATQTTLTKNCTTDFTDLSVCDVDSWEWTFEGGNPETSNEQFPQGIGYTNEGSFDVSLTVGNEWGENTITLPNYVTVSSTALPQVNFSASDTLVCTGSVITFNDQTSVCPSSWKWDITPNTGFEFVDGSTETSQNPKVVFYAPGHFTIKLTATNDNGESELTRTNFIQSGGIQITNNWEQNFQTNSLDDIGWTVVNPDNSTTWDIYDVGGLDMQTKAVGIKLFDYFSFNQRDQIISPPLNPHALKTPGLLTFKYAYTTTKPDFSDSLIVKISYDCGETWTRILALGENGSNNFITRETSDQNFVPQNASDWCGFGFGANCPGIDLPDLSNHQDVKIMFESASLIGNNLYIADVRLDIYQNIPETKTEEILSVYPNPSSGLLNISPKIQMDYLNCLIYNQQGQLLLSYEFGPINPENIQQLDLTGYCSGIYILRMEGSTVSVTKKIIVN